MHLTRLSLTNFRSFGGQTQTIDFGKVTLLFGPNSVGKSTVLLALFYVQEILAKGDCNPQYIEALGDKYVGGFKNLVNGKDLNKTIKIKLAYEKSSIGSTYFSIIDLIKDKSVTIQSHDDEMLNLDFSQMESAAEQAKVIAIEFEIAWTSVKGGSAYVKDCGIEMDGLLIAHLSSNDGSNPKISELNYLHPLLLPSNHNDWLMEMFEMRRDIHNDLLARVCELTGLADLSEEKCDLAEDQLSKELENLENPITTTDDAFVSIFHEFLCVNIPHNEYDNSTYMSLPHDGDSTLLHDPLSFKNSYGALPQLGQLCVTGFEAPDAVENKAVHEIISDVIVAPLDNLLQLLKESLSIGPLRAVPTKESQPKTSPTQKGWFDGSAGWACLVREQERILPIISKKLDKGIYKELSNEIDAVLGANTITKTDIWLSKLGYQLASEQAVGKQNLLYAQASIIQLDEWFSGSLGLYDLHNKVFVQPSDTGVGVSQLLPLIVAAVTIKKGFVAIEQPELHVHPRVQVDVGDLLTQIVDGPNFIVETHSEHIILRLLKRIRQTTDGELPEGFVPVTPDDVSINYLNSSEHGVQITRLNIDEDGDFIDRWPGGFFDERDEELF